MRLIVKNLIRLKNYFSLIGSSKNIQRAELLSSNESLKAFGKAWNESDGGDVMMMVALAEYEFTKDGPYEEREMAAVQVALSKVVGFMRDCGTEWKEFENKQASQARQ